MKDTRIYFIALLLAPLAELNAADTTPPATFEFNRDLRPILSDNCFYCHGNDLNHRQAELRPDVCEELPLRAKEVDRAFAAAILQAFSETVAL